MDAESYRKLQDASVTGNHGATLTEVLTIFTCLPLLVLVSTRARCNSSFIEFILLVLPIIALLTKYTNVVPRLALCAVLAMCCITGFGNLMPALTSPMEKNPRWLTNFRAVTFLGTFVCILAVDFTIFPRRFAKTEIAGFAVMDHGVGFFIVCNGLVAKPTRLLPSLKAVLELTLLGFVRYAATTLADYQKHESEYGLFWNFFFTLAFCRLFTTVFDRVLRIRPMFSFIILTVLHECFLQFGLRDWVLEDSKRDSFLSANKEGIVSTLGFVALSYGSIAVGKIIKSSTCRYYAILNATGLAAITWTMAAIIAHFSDVSRRLCNAAFIVWIVCISCILIAQLIFVDAYLAAYHMYSRTLLDAINRNGLFLFLVANILTGLINLRFQTLLFEPWQGYLTLFLYCYVICLLAESLWQNNYKVRFI